MITYEVRVTKDHTKKMLEGLRKLKAKEVVVGYPMGETKERVDVTNDVNGKPVTTPAGELNNATLAYIQDRGSPAAGIPARPFLDDGVESAEELIRVQLRRAAEGAVMGDPDEVDKGLQGAGIEAVSGVRNKLTAGPFQDIADRTKEMRKARGFKGMKPLIQTGQLRMAVNYAVRRRQE